MYVAVVTPAQLFGVIIFGLLVHSVVVSMHSGFMDNGLLSVVVCTVLLLM